MSGAAESEREMAAQLQRGEAEGIESLYDRYGRLAYSLAYRILNDVAAAEEVVQGGNALVRMAKDPTRFQTLAVTIESGEQTRPTTAPIVAVKLS